MKISTIINIIGKLLIYLSLILLTPIFVALTDHNQSLVPFVLTFIITMLVGCVCVLTTKKVREITIKEGFLVVTLTWVAYAFFGALPYLFDGVFTSLTDAFFEAMSGFTTTGSTVMTNIEGASKAILYWRSLTQFLGGMGIIVLGIAILPEITTGTMELFKAEVPGPTKDRLFPKIKDTAKTLWLVYVILTVAEIILLKFGGISLYESVCHAFTTMATGGFSTRNLSIVGFNSAYIEWVMVFFMFMAGVNFTLHYHLLRGRIKPYFKSSEFRVYLGIFVLGTIFVSINIFSHIGTGILDTVRYASFQVISILTTTGYASHDFELWPAFSQVLLFLFMFLGAMAGSTGGGMKVVRIQLIIKQGFLQIKKLIHPQMVGHVKLGNRVVPYRILNVVSGFILLYLSSFVIGILIVSAFGIDFVTSFSSVAACLGNIGPGFGTVGAMDNFAHLPMVVKNVLSFLMLLGRLELYTVIVILSPAFWRD